MAFRTRWFHRSPIAPRLADRSASPARVRATAASGAAVKSAVTTTAIAVANSATVPSRLTSPRRGIEGGAHSIAAAIAWRREHPSEAAPDHHQQQRFHGELPREVQPRRADGDSHRQLGAASVGPDQRERDEIRERGGQHDDHGRQQEEHRLTKIADEHLMQRDDRTASLRAYSTGNCWRSERQIAVSSACARVASAPGFSRPKTLKKVHRIPRRGEADRGRAQAASRRRCLEAAAETAPAARRRSTNDSPLIRAVLPTTSAAPPYRRCQRR